MQKDRAGVAANLLAAALDELRRQGIAGARVVTATGNAQALRLYREAGFRRRERIEVHKGVRQRCSCGPWVIRRCSRWRWPEAWRASSCGTVRPHASPR
jgi:ribosomal protein S18 acetylase RimI-like enzyme